MTKAQTEDMLVQLRREGRNPEIVSQEEWEAALTKIDEAIEASDSSQKEALKVRMVKARTHGHLPSKATVYAMGLLVERSKVRGRNLENRLKEMAENSGFTTLEVKEKFAAEYAAVDRSRGAAVPEEYNQSSVRYATLANLPHDRSTVTALAKVKASIQRGPRRVTRAALPHRSSVIHEAGYDNGRLEISFKANPTTVYAYRDVPSSVWDRMQEGSAGSIYSREIRGNADYMYETSEEAETDAYTVRCSSCGQFASRTGHSCPRRVERESAATAGISTLPIDEAVHANPDHLVEPESDDAAIAETIQSEAPDEESPYVDPETVVDADIDESDDSIATPPVAEEEHTVTSSEEVEPVEVEMLENTDGILTITGPKNVFTEHVPTPENQRDPRQFEYPEDAQIEKTTDMKLLDTFGSPRDPSDDYIFRSSYYLTSHLSEEDKNTVRNAGPTIRFVIGKNTTGEAKILDIYDSAQFDCTTQRGTVSIVDGGDIVAAPATYIFRRRPPRPEARTYTAVENAENTRALEAKIQAQIDDGTAVEVSTNRSVTNKFRVDASLTSNIGVRFAKTADFRRAIKDGKVAVVKNTLWEIPQANSSIDDQGVFAGTRRVNISGDIAFKRKENGVMEVVSDERQLKCSCREYRTKYYCHHLNYIKRHAGNVAQQTMPAERTHRLLTAALAGRADVSVVEPKGEAPFIRFSDDNMVRPRSGFIASNVAAIPEHLRPAVYDDPTMSEMVAIYKYNLVLGRINNISTPANLTQVRNALRRADVELPVKASFYEYNGGYNNDVLVSGTYKLHASEDGAITQTGRTLKCTCSDYAENYDCKHVRSLADQHEMFLNSNIRYPDLRNAITDFRQDNTGAWADARTISDYMDHNNETVEQAAERLQRVREEHAQYERAREERRQREAAEYAERNRARDEEQRRRLAAERAERAAEQAELVGHFVEYRKSRQKAWEEVESPYSENPAEFKKAVDEALARKKKGQSAVPFMTENVTDGICADGPGTRSFGVELEFDIKRGVNKSQALRKIGEELYAAGLTNTSQQVHYHSAAQNGYQKWSFERDCTVHAELVSPIMKDTPEHWEQLRQVIEIVERNGGVTSTRAGSHVHVSSGSYQTKVAPHAELLRTFNDNEDIMYRMAANPKRGKHRGTRWCAPNTNDYEQDISKDDERSIRVLQQYDHALGLNFESANNFNWKKANVEFRLWDSTLDVGVIQQQVALSVAMTDYAERKVEAEGSSKKPQGTRKRIGHGRRRENAVLETHGVDKHNDQTFAESHADAAAFFDKMFRTKKHRDAAAALFAVNNWQKN
ncbi:MAG: amidoligase family protein [Leuconostoc sp.]|nr:amidoligase family protein [Leuconostoc sp.]